MRATGWTRGLMVLGLGGLLIVGMGATFLKQDDTPGERFRKAIEKIKKNCESRTLARGEVCGEVAKLQPADPLATEEGRFAYSIEIPNLVPEDSGYKPGMTPEQYFDHLCKTEAGEFIYKTVENVDGLYLMRIRKRATNYEMEHLYALEAPYIEVHGEYYSPEEYFVQPHMGKYHFLEMPLFKATKSQDGIKYRRYYRDENAHSGRKYQTAINGQSVFVPYIVAETETESLKSKYGITWRGITLPHDRELGIAGSELIILDLGTNEVLAVRRGFKRTGGVRNNSTGIWWLAGQTCPKLSEKPDHWFIRDVLRPAADLKAKEK